MNNLRLRFTLGIYLLLSSCLTAQVAQKNLSLLSNEVWPTSLNDVWGYADGNGREYALVGTGVGPAIVDVSDPANPQQLAWFQRPYSLWWDIKTFDHFAYACNETGGGLIIMDLSDLPDTTVVKDTIIAGVGTAHNLWVDDAGYLYLCGGNKADGLLILDLNQDPWHPNVVGTYNDAYVHDVYVRNDTAYAAELQNGLTLIDLSDRSNPTPFNNRNYAGSLTHNTWLSDDGNTVFTTDEVFAGNTIAWDISNRNNIVEQDRYRSQRDGTCVPHNVHVYQNFLVISHYRDGVVIVDATHPEYLVEVGYYDTSPLAGAGFDGCWGAYPYLPSGLILATDVLQGLDVLQPNYVGAAFTEGIVVDASTGLPLEDVAVELVGVDARNTDAQGRFLMGVADSGTQTLSFNLPGYQPFQQSIDLYNDSTRQDTFLMVPFSQGQVIFELVSAQDGLPLDEGRVRSRVMAGNDTLSYDFLSNDQGVTLASDVVRGQHRVIAGKWGYQALDTIVNIDSANQIVQLALEPGYADDFVLDLGWQVSGNALFGHWVRVRPEGTNLALGSSFLANPPFDQSGDLGSEAFVTGNATGLQTPEDHDLDGGVSILTSPVMNLSDYQEPRLNFSWWLTNSNNPESSALEQGTGLLRVELIIDGSGMLLLAEDTVLTNGWRRYESPVLPALDGIQIRVTAQAGREEDIMEAGLDQVFIRALADTTTVGLADASPQPRLWVAKRSLSTLTLGYALPKPAGSDWQIELIDLQGRTLLRQAIDPEQNQAQLPFARPGGVYLLVLRANGQVQAIQRVIHR